MLSLHNIVLLLLLVVVFGIIVYFLNYIDKLKTVPLVVWGATFTVLVCLFLAGMKIDTPHDRKLYVFLSSSDWLDPKIRQQIEAGNYAINNDMLLKHKKLLTNLNPVQTREKLRDLAKDEVISIYNDNYLDGDFDIERFKQEVNAVFKYVMPETLAPEYKIEFENLKFELMNLDPAKIVKFVKDNNFLIGLDVLDPTMVKTIVLSMDSNGYNEKKLHFERYYCRYRADFN